MNYVDSYDIFGVEIKQIPCITGTGAPSTSTVGAVGMLYMDTDTGDMYKCVATASGVYTWVGFGSPSASVTKISDVTLLSAGWVGNASPYSQIVTISGVTENSRVDLAPSVEQLAIFHNKDLAFVTENEDGIVTVYAIGQKPENDYTIQVNITEVVA